MLAILQPFCPFTMVGTIRPLISGAVAEQDTNTVDPVKEVATLSHPLAGIVDEPVAKQVILAMLHSGVPESVVLSIFDTGYYEIVVPPKPTCAPYIAITYTNDIKEGHMNDLNSQPAQDAIFLTIPKLGMTAVERGEWEDEEAWDGYQWGSVEYYQESGEVDAIPWPALYTIAELEDLESVSGLQIYFAECDFHSLDPSVSTMDSGVEPWYCSKSHSSSPHMDFFTQEWSAVTTSSGIFGICSLSMRTLDWSRTPT
ncbi:hypothetical protein RSAG8_06773, partial [Rhizoctonia solani AG-8 WAC10335]